MEELSQRLILETTPAAHQLQTAQMMDLLCALNREYHDFKGHPTISAKTFASYLNLSVSETEALMQDMTFTRIMPAELLELGFDFTQQLVNPVEIVEVNFPHRRMIFMTGQDYYLDPQKPGKRYV